MWKVVIRFLNRLVLGTLVNIRVIDRHLAEKVDGGHIIVSNHLGMMDIFLLYYVDWHDDIIVITAEKYQKYALARWIARKLDILFVDRFGADMAVVRKIFRRLQAGGVLIIAPEGTRSPTGGLIEGQLGAAYLGMKLKTPIVPASIEGSQDKIVTANWKRLRRPEVRVRFGGSFRLGNLPKQHRDTALQEGMEEIMCRIGALLAPEFRGIYANHPRLLALLEEQEASERRHEPAEQRAWAA